MVAEKIALTNILVDADGTLYHHKVEVQGYKIGKKLGISDTGNYIDQYYFACKILTNYMHDKRITYGLMANFFEENIPILQMYGKSGKNFLDCFNEGLTASVDPHAKEILEYLSFKYKLKLFSDWLWICQMSLLKKFDLLKYFDEIHCVDGHFPKSNIKAKERLKDTKNSIILGDGINTDLVFAKNVNIPCVLLQEQPMEIPEECNNVLIYKMSLDKVSKIL